MRFVSAHDSFRRTIRFGVRSVSAYDPFQRMILSSTRSVSVRNSFRCAIHFGVQFVSASVSFSARFVRCAFRFPLYHYQRKQTSKQLFRGASPGLFRFAGRVSCGGDCGGGDGVGHCLKQLALNHTSRTDSLPGLIRSLRYILR